MSSVHIQLHPVLAERSIDGHIRTEIEFSPGITAGEALKKVIPEKDLKWIIIFVNDKMVDPEYELEAGDRVMGLLPIAGG
jgi:sulfur carrier protein ThiS